ncbi:MAG: winged helix-turn-helix transcriptional regulator [Acidobacteria bacterium]|nr:winged helix-turn-helix transcriptional regulator [Acidobacteriota bacterium]
MPKQMIDSTGLCQASICTEDEVAVIQSELDKASPWMRPTIRWVEAIKDPTRFKLVYLLYQHDQLCVCDLANILGVTSSAVSQHLRKLKDMDLVTAFRQKQTMFYALRGSEFTEFLDRIVGAEVAPDQREAVPARA